MIDKARRLEELQIRLSNGDAGAADELRREFAPWVEWIVRRMMRLRQAGLPLQSLLQAAMDRLPADVPTQPAEDNPRLARQIAQRLWGTLIDRLRFPYAFPSAGRRGKGWRENRQDTVRD